GKTAIHQPALRFELRKGFRWRSPQVSSHSATITQAGSPSSTRRAKSSMMTGGREARCARLIRAKWMTSPTVTAGSSIALILQSHDAMRPARRSPAQDSLCPSKVSNCFEAADLFGLTVGVSLRAAETDDLGGF